MRNSILKKRRIIAREHDMSCPSADKRARYDEIWLRESDTSQHNAALHASTKELDGALNGHDGSWLSTAECRWLPKTLIAHAHALPARRKSFRKIFRSKSFQDEKNIFVKNSSHPRLSATAKRRKGALLMVHSGLFLCVSLARVLVSLCVICSPESWK